MKYKLLLGLVLFTGFAFSAFSQEVKRGSGLYMDAGIGLGDIQYYDDEANALVKDLLDAGFERTGMSVDMSIGGAIMKNLYFVGSAVGFGDRLEHNADNVKTTIVLLGFGLKYYPFSFINLQFGCDFGLGEAVVNTSLGGVNTEVTSDYGYALKPSLAYDFGSRPGLNFLLGAECLIAFIEGETVTGWTVFLKLAYR
jgi:hypothetical protein